MTPFENSSRQLSYPENLTISPYASECTHSSQQQLLQNSSSNTQYQSTQSSPNPQWTQSQEYDYHHSNTFETMAYYSIEESEMSTLYPNSYDLPMTDYSSLAYETFQQPVLEDVPYQSFTRAMSPGEELLALAGCFPQHDTPRLSFSGITTISIAPSSNESSPSSEVLESSPNISTPRRTPKAYSSRKPPANRGEVICPFPDCFKTFQKQWQLNRHMPYHTKPYLCQHKTCNTRFGSTKDLRRHELEAHKEFATAEDYITCPARCGFISTRKDAIKRHVKKKHPEGIHEKEFRDADDEFEEFFTFGDGI